MSMRISAIFILYEKKSFSCNAIEFAAILIIRIIIDTDGESALYIYKKKNFNVCTPEIDTFPFYIRLCVKQ